MFLFAKQTNPKPVKQEVSSTVILPPLVFPDRTLQKREEGEKVRQRKERETTMEKEGEAEEAILGGRWREQVGNSACVSEPSGEERERERVRK